MAGERRGQAKLAEIVQAKSAQERTAFVKVHAAARARPMLEAELLGAEAGAFTGSTKAARGKLRSRPGGTLFLDEIGNLSATGSGQAARGRRPANSSDWDERHAKGR